MHPLEGPRLKVRRAVSEIQRLRVAEEAFRCEADYKIVRAEFHGKTGQDVYRVRMGRTPDLEWGVYIGEVAHNLRSALDGLVYQLVLLNGKTPTKTTQFPIFLVGETTRKGGRGLIPHFKDMKLGSGLSMIQGVAKEHQALIEGLQPYKSIGKHSLAGHGRDNALHLLRELNNADKHRLLQVVGAKVGVFTVGFWENELGKGFERSPAIVLKDGTKILEAPKGVHVNPKLMPLIAFSEGCEAVKFKGVVSTLSRIAKHVELILESFESAFPDTQVRL